MEQGIIKAVCTSDKKGIAKQACDEVKLIENHGIEGDCHGGTERQVSLLSYERVREFEKSINGNFKLEAGAFGENLLVSGLDFKSLSIGSKLKCEEVLLEITQIGKECHTDCNIAKHTGKCIMPTEGVFAKVLKGGVLRKGDSIMINSEEMVFKAAIITVSDRSYNNERVDESGPAICDIISESGYIVIKQIIVPDEEEVIYNELISITDNQKPDIIFTTGGTGVSLRDRTPEATMRVAERVVPGISEAIRSYSMTITKRAMLSRAAAVIRKQTLIINLPGSPKAVKECLELIIPVLPHAIKVLKGEEDG